MISTAQHDSSNGSWAAAWLRPMFPRFFQVSFQCNDFFFFSPFPFSPTSCPHCYQPGYLRESVSRMDVWGGFQLLLRGYFPPSGLFSILFFRPLSSHLRTKRKRWRAEHPQASACEKKPEVDFQKGLEDLRDTPLAETSWRDARGGTGDRVLPCATNPRAGGSRHGKSCLRSLCVFVCRGREGGRDITGFLNFTFGPFLHTVHPTQFHQLSASHFVSKETGSTPSFLIVGTTVKANLGGGKHLWLRIDLEYASHRHSPLMLQTKAWDALTILVEKKPFF